MATMDDLFASQRNRLQAEVERLEHEREMLLHAPVPPDRKQFIEELRHNRYELQARLARLRGSSSRQALSD